jgi:hypothetical protein
MYITQRSNFPFDPWLFTFFSPEDNYNVTEQAKFAPFLHINRLSDVDPERATAGAAP